jgi:hypothetical protein
MGKKEVSKEVEHLVQKYTMGSGYDLTLAENRLQKELALAKQDIDAINLEIEKNMITAKQTSKPVHPVAVTECDVEESIQDHVVVADNFMMLDNLMDEKNIGLLNDPVQLSKSLKQQFDQASRRVTLQDESMNI